jgi:hypothetical protein
VLFHISALYFRKHNASAREPVPHRHCRSSFRDQPHHRTQGSNVRSGQPRACERELARPDLRRAATNRKGTHDRDEARCVLRSAIERNRGWRPCPIPVKPGAAEGAPIRFAVIACPQPAQERYRSSRYPQRPPARLVKMRQLARSWSLEAVEREGSGSPQRSRIDQQNRESGFQWGATMALKTP